MVRKIKIFDKFFKSRAGKSCSIRDKQIGIPKTAIMPFKLLDVGMLL